MAPIAESTESSLFHLTKITQYIALPPSGLANPLPAACASIISPLLLTYYPPARGIVLAYQNVKLSSSPPQAPKPSRHSTHTAPPTEDESIIQGGELLSAIIDEYSAVYFWVTADLLVWRPEKNAWIEGRVTHQSSSHITLSHLNSFNISVLATSLPRDWTFTFPASHTKAAWKRAGASGKQVLGDEEGYWVDGEGSLVEETLRLRITDWEFRRGGGKGVLRVEGRRRRGRVR
ncbi:hypothetical protein P154DRAFT_331490 [Amniculicola lignicola CBS 123094]|uniref:DNA-directed RNA polymerase subunit n=1 Tax=Amniculicola lignicola CBS 123094 TaxID=1392246 RepID=A0A6A5W9V8_9PLEO|nr:hypothetical protein P154DRAFT_331490 [Amniculicola lignicola CBS 123094]